MGAEEEKSSTQTGGAECPDNFARTVKERSNTRTAHHFVKRVAEEATARDGVQEASSRFQELRRGERKS